MVSWRSVRKAYPEQTVITATMLPTREVRSTLTTNYWNWKGDVTGDQDRGSFGRVLKWA